MMEMSAAPGAARVGLSQPARSGVGLQIDAVEKVYGPLRAIDGVSLSITPGEFVALLGPSGCGKTTLLRSLSGLEAPDGGRIRFGETVVADAAARIFLPPEKRNIGMVFQDYALWPHMRVRDNVAFPLQMRRTPKAEQTRRVQAALERVALGHLGDRFPAALSGGQQQRVALARAIVSEPDVILFDEPLSNLDAGLRDALGREMARLVREIGMTAVYVTHDQGEALSLADRVAVMRAGQVVQFTTPEDLYNNPADAWVAGFLKAGTLVTGTVSAGQFCHGPHRLCLKDLAPVAEGPATLLLPSSALTVAEDAAEADLSLTATMTHFKGDRYEIEARWGDGADSPELLLWHHRGASPGTVLPVRLSRPRLRLFSDPCHS